MVAVGCMGLKRVETVECCRTLNRTYARVAKENTRKEQKAYRRHLLSPCPLLLPLFSLPETPAASTSITITRPRRRHTAVRCSESRQHRQPGHSSAAGAGIGTSNWPWICQAAAAAAGGVTATAMDHDTP